MSLVDVRRRLPAIKTLNSVESKWGILTVGSPAERLGSFMYSNPRNNYGIERVRNVWLRFLDNNLVTIEMVYDETFWNTTEDLIGEVSKTLQVPSEGWQKEILLKGNGLGLGEISQDVMTCDGFHIQVAFSVVSSGSNYYPIVCIEATSAAEVINQRHEQYRQEQAAKSLQKSERERKTFSIK